MELKKNTKMCIDTIERARYIGKKLEMQNYKRMRPLRAEFGLCPFASGGDLP